MGLRTQEAKRLVSTIRFQSKVDKTGKCWVWKAARVGNGYASFWVGGGHGSMYAHRISYIAAIGEIPEGIQLDHICRNRACVNPEHLEPVTCKENVKRGLKVDLKETCGAGLHEWSEENIYTAPSTGRRLCKPCRRKRNAEYMRKNKNTRRK